MRLLFYPLPDRVITSPLKGHTVCHPALLSSIFIVYVANETPDSETVAVKDVSGDCSFLKPPLKGAHGKYKALISSRLAPVVIFKPSWPKVSKALINCGFDCIQCDGKTCQLAV